MPDMNYVQNVYGDGDMNEKMDSMENKCCSQSMRVWVIICNIILLLLALASFGIGIFVQTQPGFAWTAGSVGVGLIFIGVFMLLLAILGGVAGWRQSKCLFGIYGTLLLIFFIAQLAALVVALGMTNVLVDAAAESWNGMGADNQHALGMFFGCCGVDPKDEKYSKEGDTTFTTCLEGTKNGKTVESVLKDDKTWTKWTGVCQVFGLDYVQPGDGKETVTNFPSYNKAYMENGWACAPKKVTVDDYNTCSKIATPTKAARDKLSTTAAAAALNAAKVLCVANDKCKWAETSACAPTTKTAEDKQQPTQCLCPIVDKAAFVDCRVALGAIPECDTKEVAPFPFHAGVSDAFYNGKVSSATAACYAKLELFLGGNVAALVVIGLIFVYQLVLLVFSFALCCCVTADKKRDRKSSSSSSNNQGDI